MFFGEQHWQLRPHLAQMQRENDSVLGEQSSDLIAELRAATDQPAANAMERLQILLPNRLLRHKSHLRPADRFANRRGISYVVLLPL
jgi:hypothetical protein